MTIVYPMGLMAIFTMLYSVVLISSRIRAVKSNDIKHSYFREYNNDTPPDYMQKATRHWSNLFELPVLFYVACATVLALRLEDALLVYLAYAFFGLRLIQAYIHTTYNRVNHRLAVFFLGLATLLTLWIRLLVLV